MAQDYPERRELQFLAQSTEDFVARIRPLVVCEFLERVALGRFEKSPQLVFSDEVLGVGNVCLFQNTIAVHADKKIRNVFLKGQLGWLLPPTAHVRLVPRLALNRSHAICDYRTSQIFLFL